MLFARFGDWLLPPPFVQRPAATPPPAVNPAAFRTVIVLALGAVVGPGLAAQSILFAPTLKTLWRNTAPAVAAGEHVGFSFTQTTGSAPVQRTSFWFTDPTGATVEFGKDFQSVGSVVLPTQPTWATGRYRLDEISIASSNGVQISFRRDGSVSVRPPFTRPGDPAPQVQAPRTHTFAFAALDFDLHAAAGGTAVSGSLAGDTRWTAAGSPYRLTNKVVIPGGTTLTIEPGARVVGAGHPLEVTGRLEVFGTAATPAVLSNVKLLPAGGTNSQPFLIKLDRATMLGGTLWPITVADVKGTVEARDSVFVDVVAARSLIRFPVSDTIFERNLFYHSAGMTLGTGGGSSGGITLRHNVFFEPDIQGAGGSQATDALFLIFEQSGGPITIKGNSFLTVSSFPALRTVQGISLSLDASGNYFDPVTLATGRAVQVDGVPTITIVPLLTEPAAATPALPAAPILTESPGDLTTPAGEAVTLTAGASGAGDVWYQWYQDGNLIPGATGPILAVPSATPADAGVYTVVAGNFGGSVSTAPATLAVTGDPLPLTSWLTNVSVRTALRAGQPPLVVGFATNGSKSLLVRAAGPALADYGVGQPLSDPGLSLYAGGEPLAGNDDWPEALAPRFAELGAFPFAPGSKDSAVLQTVQGPATAHAAGTGNGVVLVEAYDTDPTSSTHRLVNVSARNHVGTGSDVLITGFFLHGTGTKRLLIRGVGPKLLDYNVTGVLADPKLEVYNQAGTRLATNDNWQAALTSTFVATQAFPLNPGSKDAALVVTLPAGAGYSVQLSGADGGTGEALVEVYEVP